MSDQEEQKMQEQIEAGLYQEEQKLLLDRIDELEKGIQECIDFTEMPLVKIIDDYKTAVEVISHTLKVLLGLNEDKDNANI